MYQRADLNRVLISQAVGAFCHIKQDVTSYNYTEGAVVALDMTEYERERDQCPMYFDDGAYPWQQTESYIKIFNWDFIRNSATRTFHSTHLLTLILCSTILLRLLIN